MNLFVILIIVVLVVVVALVALKAKGAPQTSQSSASEPSGTKVVADLYRVKKSLFSPAERSFVGVLETSISGR
jgi:hypothetical protein